MADLTCGELVELVTDYLEGALDEETTERFERHVAFCPGCETYLNQMKETATILGEIPVETLSEETHATLLETFRDFPAEVSHGPSAGVGPPAVVAVAAKEPGSDADRSESGDQELESEDDE